MKKLLTLVIVFSLALVLNNVSFAQEAVVATELAPQEVQSVAATQDCSCCPPVQPRPCPLFRPFVRHASTPCIANPCNPCPPAPCMSEVVRQPACAPMSYKPFGAPCFAAAHASYAYAPCAQEQASCYPCASDYGHQPGRIRSLLSRLFSKFHSYDYNYGGYPYPYTAAPAFEPAAAVVPVE